MKSDLFYVVDVLYSWYKQDKLTQEEHRQNVERFFEWLGEDIKSLPFHPFYTQEGKEIEKRLEKKTQEALKRLGARQDLKDVLIFLLCIMTDRYREIYTRFSYQLILKYLSEKKDEIKESLRHVNSKCSESAVDVDHIKKHIEEVLKGIEVIGNVAYLTIERYINNEQELQNDLRRLREEIEKRLAEKKYKEKQSEPATSYGTHSSPTAMVRVLLKEAFAVFSFLGLVSFVISVVLFILALVEFVNLAKEDPQKAGYRVSYQEVEQALKPQPESAVQQQEGPAQTHTETKSQEDILLEEILNSFRARGFNINESYIQQIRRHINQNFQEEQVRIEYLKGFKSLVELAPAGEMERYLSTYDSLFTSRYLQYLREREERKQNAYILAGSALSFFIIALLLSLVKVLKAWWSLHPPRKWTDT